MNKQPPAIVRVRVRGGIVRIPGQQASRQTITIVTANFKDARNKRGNRNTRSPTEIICFLNFSAWAMVENNVFRYFRIFQKNRSACADFDYGSCFKLIHICRQRIIFCLTKIVPVVVLVLDANLVLRKESLKLGCEGAKVELLNDGMHKAAQITIRPAVCYVGLNDGGYTCSNIYASGKSRLNSLMYSHTSV